MVERSNEEAKESSTPPRTEFHVIMDNENK